MVTLMLHGIGVQSLKVITCMCLNCNFKISIPTSLCLRYTLHAIQLCIASHDYILYMKGAHQLDITYT